MWTTHFAKTRFSVHNYVAAMSTSQSGNEAMSSEMCLPTSSITCTTKMAAVAPERLTTVSLACIGLFEINTAESKFAANFRLCISFPGPKEGLSQVEAYKTVKNRIYYHPDAIREVLPAQAVEFANALDVTWKTSEFYEDEQSYLVFHDSDDDPFDPNLLRVERIIVGTFKHPFALMCFPYDHQKLPIRLRFWRKTAEDYTRQYRSEQVPRSSHISDDMASFSDWDVDMDAVQISHSQRGFGTSEDVADMGPLDVTLEIPITRKWGEPRARANCTPVCARL